MNNLIRTLIATAAVAGAASISAEDAATGIVVTSDDQSQRCILPLVVTAVDGQEVEDGAATDRFEFEAGPHSIGGYGAGDPALCKTFAADGGLPVPEGPIGESTLKLDVAAGKAYYLGVDVRSSNTDRWKIVTWKIEH